MQGKSGLSKRFEIIPITPNSLFNILLQGLNSFGMWLQWALSTDLSLEILNFKLSPCNKDSKTKSKAFCCPPGWVFSAWWICFVSFQEGIPESCGIDDVGSATLLQVGGGLDDPEGLFQLCVSRISHLLFPTSLQWPTEVYLNFFFFSPRDFLDKTTWACSGSWKSLNGIGLQIEIQTFPVPSEVLHREWIFGSTRFVVPGAQRDLQVGNSSSRVGAKSQFQVDFLRPENAAEMPEICISCPKTLFEWEKDFWMEKEWTSRKTWCRNCLC